MKIPGSRTQCSKQMRLVDQLGGDQVLDAIDSLQPASDTEQARFDQYPALALAKITPDDDVHHAVFVLKGDEGDSAGGLRALASGDQAGDGHAAQGNGEVTITALETSLIGTFEFILHKKIATPYPRAETPTAYIAMGFDDDLSNATRKAVRNMIDFLVTAKGMTRDDAYMLISVSGDVEITELVDRNKGVHVVLPKSVFVAR